MAEYIDKTGLVADMRVRLRHMIESPVPPVDEDYARGVRAGYEIGINWVSSCEPASVREAVLGCWISDRGDVVPMEDGVPQRSCSCSVCGSWLVGSDEYAVIGRFCPSCGAQMMGGAEDG